MIAAPAGISSVDPLCPLLAGCAIVHSVAGSLATSASRAVAGSVFAAFTSWLSAGAAWLVPHVVALAVGARVGTGRRSGIDLTSSWFTAGRESLFALSGLALLAMLCAATIGAIVHQDLRRLARTWAVYLPVSIVGGALAVVLTEKALQLCDAMCAAVSAGAGRAGYGAFARLVRAALVPGIPQFVAVMVSVLLIIGSVLLWLELVLRGAAVYLAVFLLPLALAGLVWPATALAAKRMVEILVALVFSKFVIVASLTLGLGAIGAAHGVDATLTGSAIMLMSAFAPFAVMRLAPLVEVAAIGHLEGMSARPHQAVRRAATAMAYAPNHPAAALLGRVTSQGGSDQRGGDATRAVAARITAEHAGDWPVPPAPTTRSSVGASASRGFPADSGGPASGGTRNAPPAGPVAGETSGRGARRGAGE